jgi:hypothetical protein
MSAISGTTSSAVAYATQLAQASALRQSLNNIGNAIQTGDMTTANTLLTAFIKNNPQYAAGSTTASQDPISQDFQTLVTAVSNNQVSAAHSAWTQVKSDLAKDGVNLSSAPASTAETVAQSQASMNQELLSDIFGTSSGTASLLGGSGDSKGSVGLSGSLLSAWISAEDGTSTTPSQTASATSTTASTTGGILNTTG